MKHNKQWAAYQERIKRFRDQYVLRRDRLLDQIEKAFAHVSRDDGITLHQARVIDNYGDQQEQQRARVLDTDTHWSQVDVLNIDLAGACLTFLDDVGYRYYLPAYMTATLTHAYRDICDEVIDSNVYDHVVYSLDKHTQADHARYALLTPPQSRCVARFLAFDMELDPFYTTDDWVVDTSNYKALDRYWKKFLSPTELKHLHQIWPKAF